MSPNTPNDFIGSLVEMAEAYRELPKVRDELSAAHRDVDRLQTTVQRLELKLIERANEIAELQTKQRSLEVERDEAQFHALEADDRTQRALEFIKATFGNAGALIQALEPPAAPKSEPAASEVPVQAMPEAAPTVTLPAAAEEGGQGDNPLPPSGEQSTRPTSSSFGTPETASHSSQEPSAAPYGHVHEPHPADARPHDAPTVPEVTASPGEPAAASTAGSSAHGQSSVEAVPLRADATPTNSPDVKSYAGRRYSEVANSGHYPTREEWEAGGGTVDNWYA